MNCSGQQRGDTPSSNALGTYRQSNAVCWHEGSVVHVEKAVKLVVAVADDENEAVLRLFPNVVMRFFLILILFCVTPTSGEDVDFDLGPVIEQAKVTSFASIIQDAGKLDEKEVRIRGYLAEDLAGARYNKKSFYLCQFKEFASAGMHLECIKVYGKFDRLSESVDKFVDITGRFNVSEKGLGEIVALQVNVVAVDHYEGYEKGELSIDFILTVFPKLLDQAKEKGANVIEANGVLFSIEDATQLIETIEYLATEYEKEIQRESQKRSVEERYDQLIRAIIYTHEFK